MGAGDGFRVSGDGAGDGAGGGGGEGGRGVGEGAGENTKQFPPRPLPRGGALALVLVGGKVVLL